IRFRVALRSAVTALVSSCIFASFPLCPGECFLGPCLGRFQEASRSPLRAPAGLKSLRSPNGLPAGAAPGRPRRNGTRPSRPRDGVLGNSFGSGFKGLWLDIGATALRAVSPARPRADARRDIGYQKVRRGASVPSNKKHSLRKKNRSEERRVGKECRSRWSPYH